MSKKKNQTNTPVAEPKPTKKATPIATATSVTQATPAPTTFEEQDYDSSVNLGVWKRILPFVMKYKGLVIKMVFVSILSSFADAVRTQLVGYAIDDLIEAGDLSGLAAFAAAFIVLMLVTAWATFLFVDIAGTVQVNVVHDVREKGFRRLQELSFSYYDTTPVGWMISRMTGDAQRIGDVISWSFLDFMEGFARILFYVFFMFMNDVKLALITLAVVPPLAVVSVYMQRKILAGHREARKINSKITGSFNEGINGARTTKTLVREARNFEEFRGLSGAMRKASVHVSMLSAAYFPIIVSLGGVSVAMVLGIGGEQVASGILTYGTLSIFLGYATSIFEPITQIARVLSEMLAAQASAERTLTLLETEPDVKDSPELLEKYGDFMHEHRENWEAIKGEIEFRNVTFKYKTGEQVLDNFSLHVKHGERIALVGETGSGKSTIINLICRFYEPTSGQILIDGVDYRERTQNWLHSNLGYVLQTPHLFSGSVRDNIRYGKLDATDEEIIAAAKLVDAYDFIMRMEKGFDSEVGEGGGRMSAGQRQLISFARAIIGNPAIFVLDEATSSIDTETEMKLQGAIESVLAGRTSFIVAHRLSTVRSCDRILVIDKGEVIESGSHRQLLERKGHYYKLYTNQFRDEVGSRILSGEPLTI